MNPPPTPLELFLSHSRKANAPRRPADPKGWVETLRDEGLTRHRGLSTAPLRVFFDQDDIHGMDDWRHRILKGGAGVQYPPRLPLAGLFQKRQLSVGMGGESPA